MSITAPDIEQLYVKAILGKQKASALDTDAYKLSMAQAGFPLRQETFCLTFRKGKGPWYIPFDLEWVIRLMLPELPSLKERGFLQAWGYGLTPAMEEALQGGLDIWAAEKGTWVGKGEPILTLTGPSFLVSWFEPLMLMLNYPIQVATALLAGEREFPVSCTDEGDIVALLAQATGIKDYRVSWNNFSYPANVKLRAEGIDLALKGEASSRAFEVGMRAATCLQQHKIALKACKEMGIQRTSNLGFAYALNMIPVGTTGHEHQQRFGLDEVGFRAIRDSRPEMPSYLFDTYDPLQLGIPAVCKVVGEDEERSFSVRFDSGDQDAQFIALEKGLTMGAEPIYIFEDGYTAEKTQKNEAFLHDQCFPEGRALYGYGGFLVSSPSPSPYTRDVVSAAYKLSQTTGRPTMKFSGSPGKASLPGKPCIFYGNDGKRLVGQIGEEPPPNYTTRSNVTKPDAFGAPKSPATADMVKRLTEEKDNACS